MQMFKLLGICLMGMALYMGWALLRYGRGFSGTALLVICVIGGVGGLMFKAAMNDEAENDRLKKEQEKIKEINKKKEVIDAADMLANVLNAEESDNRINQIDQIDMEELEKWQCSNCGFVIEGKKSPEECPSCHQKSTFFCKETDKYRELNETSGADDVDSWFE